MLNLLARSGQRASNAEGHADKGSLGRLDGLLLDGQQPDEVLDQRAADLKAVSELQRHDFTHAVEVEHLTDGFVVSVRLAEVVMDGAVGFVFRRGMGPVKPGEKRRCITDGGRHGCREFGPDAWQAKRMQKLPQAHGASLVHFAQHVGSGFFSHALQTK